MRAGVGQLRAAESEGSAADADSLQPLAIARLATDSDGVLYNSVRLADDRLDSSPFAVELALSQPLWDRLGGSADAVAAALRQRLHVEVTLFSGEQVKIYTDDIPHYSALRPLEARVAAVTAGGSPVVDLEEAEADSGLAASVTSARRVTLAVPRALPLSSSNSGSTFRLAVYVDVPENTGSSSSSGGGGSTGSADLPPAVLAFTEPFRVLAKQGRRGSKQKQIYLPVYEQMPADRARRLAVILACAEPLKQQMSEAVSTPVSAPVDMLANITADIADALAQKQQTQQVDRGEAGGSGTGDVTCKSCGEGAGEDAESASSSSSSASSSSHTQPRGKPCDSPVGPGGVACIAHTRYGHVLVAGAGEVVQAVVPRGANGRKKQTASASPSRATQQGAPARRRRRRQRRRAGSDDEEEDDDEGEGEDDNGSTTNGSDINNGDEDVLMMVAAGGSAGGHVRNGLDGGTSGRGSSTGAAAARASTTSSGAPATGSRPPPAPFAAAGPPIFAAKAGSGSGLSSTGSDLASSTAAVATISAQQQQQQGLQAAHVVVVTPPGTSSNMAAAQPSSAVISGHDAAVTVRLAAGAVSVARSAATQPGEAFVVPAGSRGGFQTDASIPAVVVTPTPSPRLSASPALQLPPPAFAALADVQTSPAVPARGGRGGSRGGGKARGGQHRRGRPRSSTTLYRGPHGRFTSPSDAAAIVELRSPSGGVSKVPVAAVAQAAPTAMSAPEGSDAVDALPPLVSPVGFDVTAGLGDESSSSGLVSAVAGVKRKRAAASASSAAPAAAGVDVAAATPTGQQPPAKRPKKGWHYQAVASPLMMSMGGAGIIGPDGSLQFPTADGTLASVADWRLDHGGLQVGEESSPSLASRPRRAAAEASLRRLHDATHDRYGLVEGGVDADEAFPIASGATGAGAAAGGYEHPAVQAASGRGRGRGRGGRGGRGGTRAGGASPGYSAASVDARSPGAGALNIGLPAGHAMPQPPLVGLREVGGTAPSFGSELTAGRRLSVSGMQMAAAGGGFGIAHPQHYQQYAQYQQQHPVAGAASADETAEYPLPATTSWQPDANKPLPAVQQVVVPAAASSAGGGQPREFTAAVADFAAYGSMAPQRAYRVQHAAVHQHDRGYGQPGLMGLTAPTGTAWALLPGVDNNYNANGNGGAAVGSSGVLRPDGGPTMYQPDAYAMSTGSSSCGGGGVHDMLAGEVIRQRGGDVFAMPTPVLGAMAPAPAHHPEGGMIPMALQGLQSRAPMPLAAGVPAAVLLFPPPLHAMGTQRPSMEEVDSSGDALVTGDSHTTATGSAHADAAALAASSSSSSSSSSSGSSGAGLPYPRGLQRSTSMSSTPVQQEQEDEAQDGQGQEAAGTQQLALASSSVEASVGISGGRTNLPSATAMQAAAVLAALQGLADREPRSAPAADAGNEQRGSSSSAGGAPASVAAMAGVPASGGAGGRVSA